MNTFTCTPLSAQGVLALTELITYVHSDHKHPKFKKKKKKKRSVKKVSSSNSALASVVPRDSHVFIRLKRSHFLFTADKRQASPSELMLLSIVF